jgi:hypothetical protein
MDIKKGDIIEVINIDVNTGFNGKIAVGNRYIATSDTYGPGQINIENPLNSSYGSLMKGQYILYRKSEDLGKV